MKNKIVGFRLASVNRAMALANGLNSTPTRVKIERNCMASNYTNSIESVIFGGNTSDKREGEKKKKKKKKELYLIWVSDKASCLNIAFKKLFSSPIANRTNPYSKATDGFVAH